MKRWFQSRTIWLNLLAMLANAFTAFAAMAVTVAPQALALLPTLGLAPNVFLIWTVAGNVIITGLNLYLRKHSPAVIGNRQDVVAFDDWTERVELSEDL